MRHTVPDLLCWCEILGCSCAHAVQPIGKPTLIKTVILAFYESNILLVALMNNSIRSRFLHNLPFWYNFLSRKLQQIYLSWGIIISVSLRWVINSTNGNRNYVSYKHNELNKEEISSSIMLHLLHCAFSCLSFKRSILKCCYLREYTDPLKPQWLLYILLGSSSSNSTNFSRWLWMCFSWLAQYV